MASAPDDPVDEAERIALEDPMRNAQVGCLGPLIRSFALAGGTLIAVTILCLTLGLVDWLIMFWLGGAFLLWLVERGRSAEKARERRALERLFGVRRR